MTRRESDQRAAAGDKPPGPAQRRRPAGQPSGPAPRGRRPEFQSSGPAQRPGASGGRPLFPGHSKLTGRAAVLAVVLCAIALSLAYPVREYIAERRQIDQLQAQNAAIAAQVRYLKSEQRALTSPGRIEQEARDTLHMCFPSQTCYEVIPATTPHRGHAVHQVAAPWYGRLWESVREADGTART